MKVNSNIQAMIAGNVLKNNEIRQSNSTQKLSSGYRINKAKDNPAGMAISNRMRAQIQNLNRANQNASNAVNVIETAEGALGEMQDMVQRISELSIKAANGTNTEEDREAIQSEINQLTKEIDRISRDTEYNSQKLLNGEQGLKGYVTSLWSYNGTTYSPVPTGLSVVSYDPEFPLSGGTSISFDKYGYRGSVSNVSITGISSDNIEVEGNLITATTSKGAKLVLKVDDSIYSVSGNHVTGSLDLSGIGGMKIQVGGSEGQEINIIIPRVSSDTLGLSSLNVTYEMGAQDAIEKAKSAISYISSVRSRLGAYENRFEKTISNLDVAEENLTQSYSTLKDVDMAEEMVNYTTLQVLVQAGTSMLSQANEQPQQALQLLQ